MMFRRVDDEEESGSDWDEMSPRNSPARESLKSHSPSVSPLPPPHHQPLPQTSLSPPSAILLHTASPPGGVSSHSTTTRSSITEAEQGKGSSSQLLIPTTLSNTAIPAFSGGQTSTRDNAATIITAVTMSRDAASELTLDKPPPLQDTLTSLEEVPTPHPPLAKAPPSAKSVYRVREVIQSNDEIVAPLDEEERVQRSPPPAEPVRVQRIPTPAHHAREGNEKDDNYRADLEFLAVSREGADYLCPQDERPKAYMTSVATKWEKISERCVEEVFSTLRLVTDFLLALILGSVNCLLHHILRKLCCGLARICSESIWKPGVTLAFNGFAWPLLSFTIQVSKGLVLIIGPLLEIVGVVMSWVVQVARACRLVVISNRTYQQAGQTNSAV